MKRAEDLIRRYEDGERDFRGIQLGDVNLIGTDLRDADLTGADLAGASLLDADLRNANLARANLTGTVLAMADLRGTDLRRTSLAQADLRMATYDATTRFPPGFSPIDAGLTPQSGIVRHPDVLDAAVLAARCSSSGTISP